MGQGSIGGCQWQDIPVQWSSFQTLSVIKILSFPLLLVYIFLEVSRLYILLGCICLGLCIIELCLKQSCQPFTIHFMSHNSHRMNNVGTMNYLGDPDISSRPQWKNFKWHNSHRVNNVVTENNLCDPDLSLSEWCRSWSPNSTYSYWDFYLLSWWWQPLWSGGLLFQLPVQPKKANQRQFLFKISVSCI